VTAMPCDVPARKDAREASQQQALRLLGINTDDNKNLVKTQDKKEGITWRSWFDGSTGGPICKQFSVRSFPTIYVLDAKGVIRYKNVRGEAMDKAVDELMKDMDKKSTSSLGQPPGDAIGQ